MAFSFCSSHLYLLSSDTCTLVRTTRVAWISSDLTPPNSFHEETLRSQILEGQMIKNASNFFFPRQKTWMSCMERWLKLLAVELISWHWHPEEHFLMTTRLTTIKTLTVLVLPRMWQRKFPEPLGEYEWTYQPCRVVWHGLEQKCIWLSHSESSAFPQRICLVTHGRGATVLITERFGTPATAADAHVHPG